MNSKRTAALGVFAGFVGGVMSHYVFVLMPVHAQAPVQPPAEIRAQKFVLVDENGTPRGVFGFQSNGTPALQVSFGKPKGLQKIMSAEVGSVRWIGEDREKNIVPDLRHAPKTNPTGAHPFHQ